MYEPSDSIRRRNAQAGDSDIRVARLEDKMDALLSALQSSIKSSGNSELSVGINAVRSLDGVSASATSLSDDTLVDVSVGPNFRNELEIVSNSSSGDTSLNGSTGGSRIYAQFQFALLSSEIDERLDFFRSQMLPSFPFIDLTDTECWYLRQKRPILLQTIFTITTFSTKERLLQVEELKKTFFTTALLEVQSNIDLLLGLLTYLAWSTDAFLGRADLMSRLMMLAISVATDMRLPQLSSFDTQLLMTVTQGETDGGENLNDSPHDFLERQRALLACFYLSSKYVYLRVSWYKVQVMVKLWITGTDSHL